MLVASEFTGNELWMYSSASAALAASPARCPPESTGTPVILGNSLNTGEALYSRTPLGACEKLQMDASQGPPLSFCQQHGTNFSWSLYPDFLCQSAPLASATVTAGATSGSNSADIDEVVYCIAIGSFDNVTLECLSAASSDFSAAVDLDYDGSDNSLLPHFLQNDLPLIGGSGAGAVVLFLLLLGGLHRWQTSGLVDFAVGDVVLYTLTPQQQKRQRVHNLTKGYDFIKTRGLALVVNVPAPSFLSASTSSGEGELDPDAHSGVWGGDGRGKSILCLQPLRRVARPTSSGTAGHTSFFSQTQQQKPNPRLQAGGPRRAGLGSVAFTNNTNTAISLIREGEMELELAIDHDQRPVSSNMWGVRGGRVLSVIPLLWRRRIRLEKDVTEGLRGGGAVSSDNSDSSQTSLLGNKRLEMLSFLDVSFATNPATGKSEWVSRARLLGASSLRRRSPDRPGVGDEPGVLSPLSPARGASSSSKLGNRDAKLERRENKRASALQEKRSKRESVNRTILTADRSSSGRGGGGGDSAGGLFSLLRSAVSGVFGQSSAASTSERKRMTRIQDESVRLSSAPRKLRTVPGRNDLAVLFGGKEAAAARGKSRKAWQNVVEGAEEEDEDGDEEDWWKHDPYGEAEGDSCVDVLQPFLKQLSRAESLQGRQSRAGLGFSFVVENCKELQLDMVAYSVWNYPLSQEQEDELCAQQEQEARQDQLLLEGELEGEPWGEMEGGQGSFWPDQEGEGSDEEDEDQFGAGGEEEDDVASLFELTPPDEEPAAQNHRLRRSQQEDEQAAGGRRGGSSRGGSSRGSERDYEGFQRKSAQIREASGTAKSQKRSRKLTQRALQQQEERTEGSGRRQSQAESHARAMPSSIGSPTPSSSSHINRHLQPLQHNHNLLTPQQPAADITSSNVRNPHQNNIDNGNNNNNNHGNNSGEGEYVTPPHRMKSIVSRSTRVGGGAAAVLSNDSTKSNSADKQYLARVGDGLVPRERERHRSSRAGERERQQQRGGGGGRGHMQVLGSSLESDEQEEEEQDDLDSAAVRRPGQLPTAVVTNQQRQQDSHPGASSSPRSESKEVRHDRKEQPRAPTVGRATVLASQGADISQQAKQRRAENRSRRRQQQQQQQGGGGSHNHSQQRATEQMAIEDFD